jgi:hypothetical protein
MQYLSKLDLCLKYILDPSNFILRDSQWAGLKQYNAWLTFERISSEVIYLLTDDSPYLRKSALFRILDQIAGLLSSNHTQQVEVFKELLLPENGTDLIMQGLVGYSGNVAIHLRSLLDDYRKELVDSALKSVYVPGRVDSKEGVVRLSSGKVVPSMSYVSSLVRELRNTYHGYHTNQFDEYLAISSGNTPNSLPAMGVLAFLAMLSKPDMFIRRDWS